MSVVRLLISYAFPLNCEYIHTTAIRNTKIKLLLKRSSRPIVPLQPMRNKPPCIAELSQMCCSIASLMSLAAILLNHCNGTFDHSIIITHLRRTQLQLGINTLHNTVHVLILRVSRSASKYSMYLFHICFWFISFTVYFLVIDVLIGLLLTVFELYWKSIVNVVNFRVLMCIDICNKQYLYTRLSSPKLANVILFGISILQFGRGQ